METTICLPGLHRAEQLICKLTSLFKRVENLPSRDIVWLPMSGTCRKGSSRPSSRLLQDTLS